MTTRQKRYLSAILNASPLERYRPPPHVLAQWMLDDVFPTALAQTVSALRARIEVELLTAAAAAMSRLIAAASVPNSWRPAVALLSLARRKPTSQDAPPPQDELDYATALAAPGVDPAEVAAFLADRAATPPGPPPDRDAIIQELHDMGAMHTPPSPHPHPPAQPPMPIP